MRLVNWALFAIAVPFVAAGIGIYCFFISLRQGIELLAELLDAE